MTTTLNRNLRAQMVGFHHPCIEYSRLQFEEYYEYLREADEFGAAAGAYPDERDELMANAAHRYQLLIDWMTERLKLNVTFLNRGKIWFNFYADIAGRFGLGTQAYTTETKKPHVGVSEISLQDLYLLQLILIHEVQHATDFVNYAGLQMSIAERELRARISICQALVPMKERYTKLYQHSLLDLCFWFVILFRSEAIKMSAKQDYFSLLGDDAQYKLSAEAGGVLFSPMVLRALAKELQREQITLSTRIRYVIALAGEQLHLTEWVMTEEETPETPDLIEELMITDDELAPSSMQIQELGAEDMEALTIDFSRDVLTTKNKLTDWQPYDESYQRLKEKAMVVIDRDEIGFQPVQFRLAKGAGLQLDMPLFPQAEQIAKGLSLDMQPLYALNNLDIPDAVLDTGSAPELFEGLDAIPVQLEPLQSRLPQRHNIGEEELTMEAIMSDLSDFVREKGGR